MDKNRGCTETYTAAHHDKWGLVCYQRRWTDWITKRNWWLRRFIRGLQWQNRCAAVVGVIVAWCVKKESACFVWQIHRCTDTRRTLVSVLKISSFWGILSSDVIQFWKDRWTTFSNLWWETQRTLSNPRKKTKKFWDENLPVRVWVFSTKAS
jgi:hypothetical protein